MYVLKPVQLLTPRLTLKLYFNTPQNKQLDKFITERTRTYLHLTSSLSSLA